MLTTEQWEGVPHQEEHLVLRKSPVITTKE